MLNLSNKPSQGGGSRRDEISARYSKKIFEEQPWTKTGIHRSRKVIKAFISKGDGVCAKQKLRHIVVNCIWLSFFTKYAYEFRPTTCWQNQCPNKQEEKSHGVCIFTRKSPKHKEVKNHEYMNHASQNKQMYRKHEFFCTYEHDMIVKGDNWLPRQYFSWPLGVL